MTLADNAGSGKNKGKHPIWLRLAFVNKLGIAMGGLTSKQEELAEAISELRRCISKRGRSGCAIPVAALSTTLAAFASISRVGSMPATDALSLWPAIPFTVAVAVSARLGCRIGAVAGISLSLGAMVLLNPITLDYGHIRWLGEDLAIFILLAWCSTPRQKPPHNRFDKRDRSGVVRNWAPLLLTLRQHFIG